MVTANRKEIELLYKMLTAFLSNKEILLSNDELRLSVELMLKYGDILLLPQKVDHVLKQMNKEKNESSCDGSCGNCNGHCDGTCTGEKGNCKADGTCEKCDNSCGKKETEPEDNGKKDKYEILLTYGKNIKPDDNKCNSCKHFANEDDYCEDCKNFNPCEDCPFIKDREYCSQECRYGDPCETCDKPEGESCEGCEYYVEKEEKEKHIKICYSCEMPEDECICSELLEEINE